MIVLSENRECVGSRAGLLLGAVRAVAGRQFPSGDQFLPLLDGGRAGLRGVQRVVAERLAGGYEAGQVPVSQAPDKGLLVPQVVDQGLVKLRPGELLFAGAVQELEDRG